MSKKKPLEKSMDSCTTVKSQKLKANGFLGWHQNWILVNLDSDILADPYLEWNHDAYLDDDPIPPSNPDGTLKQLFERVQKFARFSKTFHRWCIVSGSFESSLEGSFKMGVYLRRKDDDGIRLKSGLVGPHVNNVEELVEALSEEVV
ncbi:hypothetical protein Tco_1536034, partial [Tanacetum coccineum]